MEEVRPIIFPEELNKLRGLLKAQNITYKITIDDETDWSPRIQLTAYFNDKHWSVIYCRYSYGNEKGLLEIGDLDNIHMHKDHQVEGYLEAKDCMDIITGKRKLVG